MKPQISRRTLTELLQRWLEDDSEPLNNYIRQVLEQLIEALQALDHGEVPQLLRPAPASSRRGRRPARLRQLELWALRHEEALRRHAGMKREQARAEVAAAYRRSADSIRNWRRNLAVEKNKAFAFENELKSLLWEDRQADRFPFPHDRPPPTAKSILDQAEQHGREYCKLRGEPKTTKIKKPAKAQGKKLLT